MDRITKNISLKFIFKGVLCQLPIVYCLLLFFSSCIIPFRSFDKSTPTAPPDYSQSKYWAALPTIRDSADIVPYNSNLKDEQADAKVDVFFIYPTIYLAGKHWNANLNNKNLNHRIEKSTIRHQVTVFNGSCKIYAPLYRQAAL